MGVSHDGHVLDPDQHRIQRQGWKDEDWVFRSYGGSGFRTEVVEAPASGCKSGWQATEAARWEVFLGKLGTGPPWKLFSLLYMAVLGMHGSSEGVQSSRMQRSGS